MAIYHFQGQILKRSKGANAVAAAAYRSGERLYDDNSGKYIDYTRKHGVVHSEIMLPKEAPVAFQNRQTLWNAVEASENRKDSQVAREFNAALPNELSLEQNLNLTREFCEGYLTPLGMIVDINFHVAEKGKPQNNHVHIQSTMREVSLSGFGKKNTDWNDRSLFQEWRKGWQQVVNKHLARAGFTVRVDHRSYKEQGKEIVPTKHLGPSAHSLERKGIKTELGNQNRLIRQYNIEVVTVAETEAEMRRLKALLNRKRTEGINPQPKATTEIRGWVKARFKPSPSAKAVSNSDAFDNHDNTYFWSSSTTAKNRKKVFSLGDGLLEIFSLNPLVIREAAIISKDHYFGEIEIHGEPGFCSIMWLAAALAGCNPLGYVPKESDWRSLEAYVESEPGFDSQQLSPGILRQVESVDAPDTQLDDYYKKDRPL